MLEGFLRAACFAQFLDRANDAVRKEGVEPSRELPHRNLNPARLPIPPLSRCCCPRSGRSEIRRGPGDGYYLTLVQLRKGIGVAPGRPRPRRL